MIFMIDNYDSFTYNLVQYLRMLEVEVVQVHLNLLKLAQTQHAAATCLTNNPSLGHSSALDQAVSSVTTRDVLPHLRTIRSRGCLKMHKRV